MRSILLLFVLVAASVTMAAPQAITWSVEGSLPPGLELSGDAIAGTPTEAGTFAFTLRASAEGANPAERDYTIVIADAEPEPEPLPNIVIDTLTLPGGQVGVAYSISLVAAVEQPEPDPEPEPDPDPVPDPDPNANDWFASPAGLASNDGTSESPWDLATALTSPQVGPGDNVWLRAGTYGNGNVKFVSTLIGTANQPIVVRNYGSERATIYGQLRAQSPHVWYWGLEVTHDMSYEECVITHGGQNPDAAGAAHGVKFINMVVHDCKGNGIGLWRDSVGAEAYGNIAYYTGMMCDTPERGCYHGIYSQNRSDEVKVIEDNISFSGFNEGYQTYASGDPNTGIRNYRIVGNVAAQAGALWGNDSDGFFAGLGSPAGIDNYTFSNNMTWDVRFNRLGLYNTNNRDFTIRDNYLVANVYAMRLEGVASGLVFSGNSIISNDQWWKMQTVSVPGGDFTSNQYLGRGNLSMNGGSGAVGWDTWRAAYGESGSINSPDLPTENSVFVRPNRYEPGRANVVIYNWEGAATVTVDLGGVLAEGDTYTVRDAFNFFGEPVASGTYEGSVAIPMSGLTRPVPRHSSRRPAHPAPAFGVFVVTR